MCVLSYSRNGKLIKHNYPGNENVYFNNSIRLIISTDTDKAMFEIKKVPTLKIK